MRLGPLHSIKSLRRSYKFDISNVTRFCRYIIPKIGQGYGQSNIFCQAFFVIRITLPRGDGPAVATCSYRNDGKIIGTNTWAVTD